MKFPAAEIFLIIRQFLEQPEQFSFRLLEPAMAAIQELLVVVFEEGDQEAVHGLLVLELFLAPAVLLDLLIEGLNQVGGVEAPPDCGREVVEGEQVVILQDGLGYPSGSWPATSLRTHHVLPGLLPSNRLGRAP